MRQQRGNLRVEGQPTFHRSLIHLVLAIGLCGLCSMPSWAASSHKAKGSGHPGGRVPNDVTAVGGNQEVTLTWTASPGRILYYQVLRSTTAGGPYSLIGTTATPEFTDTGLLPGVTYYYVVRWVNPGGISSGDSNEAAAPTIPAAPTNLTATGETLQVSLTWTASLGASSYLILRSTTSGGPYTVVGTSLSTTFVDTSVSAGVTYFYVVEAANVSGTSGPSNEASATPVSGRELCVANYLGNNMLVFEETQAGNVAPLRVLSVVGPGHIDPDPANDHILISSDVDMSITVFPRTAQGLAPPLQTISGSLTQLDYNNDIAVDSINGEIVVSNNHSLDLLVFPISGNGNIAPSRVITAPFPLLFAPLGIAVDAVNNEIIEANYFSAEVSVFPRTANGFVYPSRILTGFVNPKGVELDLVNDELWVTDIGANTVDVFTRAASGNATPLRQIAGPATGLNYPGDVAVDLRTDEVYVLNAFSNSITVYPRTANGNVAPSRTITGTATGMNSPLGICVCH